MYAGKRSAPSARPRWIIPAAAAVAVVLFLAAVMIFASHLNLAADATPQPSQAAPSQPLQTAQGTEPSPEPGLEPSPKPDRSPRPLPTRPRSCWRR